MKETLLIILTVATALAAAFAYQEHEQATSAEPLAHVRNEFEFTVHAPYKVTAPLFGPDGERAWAGKPWDPHFLYPQPAQDVRGAVFTVAHGNQNSYWVNTAFDLEEHHIQYVYIIPDAMATLIDVRFSVIDPATTKVDVTYERTALTQQANDHVRALGTADSKNGPEWGKQINDYLGKQGAPKPPVIPPLPDHRTP
jgi:hypothetical protein